ncbi:MAG: TPM domain-containing protein [Campylobacteraceae bacterium]|nr:TPM domain-containing protein [Campylobacteraceae bacterium]
MNKFLHVKAKGLILFCLFLFLPFYSLAKEFVINEEVIEERTAQKIEEMGQELFQKSGVKVYLIAKKSGNGENIVVHEQNFSKNITPPYAILTLFLEDQKVDIYNSPDLNREFDKESMLSPLPWTGTILPLLTGKKKDISVSAALLNGYGDIVDQIADFRKIKLESSIGSANKNTINIFKFFIYGFLVIMAILIIRKRMKKSV